MGNASKIEWTDATWNPLVGCTKVSQGCKNCYAMVMAARIANAAQARLRNAHSDPDAKPITAIQAAYRNVVRWERGGKDAADLDDKALPQWNNVVELIPSSLTIPLGWKESRMVFVNSMSDLFHESVPFEFIDKVFAVMALTPQHTYQLLTKRPDRMAEYLNDDSVIDRIGKEYAFLVGIDRESSATPSVARTASIAMSQVTLRQRWPLPSLWLGTSVEDQAAADERIPHLLRCPAAVRFLSCEPSLGSIEFSNVTNRSDAVSQLGKKALKGIHWVIAGGESGHKARPMDPECVRSLRDQCVAARVPFFFKQWGEWVPATSLFDGLAEGLKEHWFDETTFSVRAGKHRAGRLLDGREWNDMPEVAHAA